MPLVRIDFSEGRSADFGRQVGAVVYDAMVGIANVPRDDKFQVITEHKQSQLVYPEGGYLGVTYTPRIVFIQVTWLGGRSVDVKKAFYRFIADELHARLGLRRSDVFISVIDVKREDWSFGDGEMQYAPRE
jgi:phenylpyruvate tautomerase PptA (4-oxalocrotonate tautomerase family)